MTTRRNILKGGVGLAAILASGKAPAYLVKSMLAARNSISMKSGGAKLPYDAEVEYLESTGTQWIDTGIIPDANTGLQLFSASPVNTNDAYIAGERNDTGNTRWLIGWSAIAKWYCGYGETIISNVDGSPILTSINFLGDGLFKVGDSYSNKLPSLSYSPLYNIRLFGSAGVVAAYTSSAVKIYSAKISAANILLRDFIPVRFTNELGQSEGAMYDRVSGQLFRNAGTGAFIYGNDN